MNILVSGRPLATSAYAKNAVNLVNPKLKARRHRVVPSTPIEKKNHRKSKYIFQQITDFFQEPATGIIATNRNDA